jgi:hypothetical protein
MKRILNILWQICVTIIILSIGFYILIFPIETSAERQCKIISTNLGFEYKYQAFGGCFLITEYGNIKLEEYKPAVYPGVYGH